MADDSYQISALSGRMAATNLTTFNYLFNTVRVVEIDGQPWFVAADVCSTLEMALWAGTSRWLAGLDADEKRLVRRKELPQIFCGSKNAPSMNLISEPGLYKLIQSSTKPEAKKFDRWVRHDVLPTIRRDGMYVAGEEKVKTGEMSGKVSASDSREDEMTADALA